MQRLVKDQHTDSAAWKATRSLRELDCGWSAAGEPEGRFDSGTDRRFKSAPNPFVRNCQGVDRQHGSGQTIARTFCTEAAMSDLWTEAAWMLGWLVLQVVLTVVADKFWRF